MEKWNDTIFTNDGKVLLANLDSGSHKLVYTNAKMYTQDINGMDKYDVVQLKALTGEVATAPINVTGVVDNTVTANATFDNKDVKQDVQFNSVGWFAKLGDDGKETLIAISPCSKPFTLIQGANGHSTASISIDLNIAVDSASQVNLTPTEQGTVTPAMLQATITALKQKMGTSNVKNLDPQANLDDLKDPGIYSLDDSLNYVWKRLDGAIEQIQLNLTSNTIRYRIFSNNAWSAWTRFSFVKPDQIGSLLLELKQLEEKVDSKLKSSASQTDLDALTTRITTLEQDNQALKTKNTDLENRVKKLEEGAYWKAQDPITEAKFDEMKKAGTLPKNLIYDIEG